MSDELQQIKDQLDLFASRRGPAALVAAKVLSINENDSTVEVELENGGKIDDVQLRSIVKAGDKVIVIPKQNSIVLIAAINNSSEFYVVAVEEPDKIMIRKGGLQVDITDKIEIVKSGFKITVDAKVKIEKGADNLKDAFVKTIEATQQIVVIYGNNPDYTKLSQALITINNIMN